MSSKIKGGSTFKLLAAVILLFLLFGLALFGLAAMDGILDNEMNPEYFEEDSSEDEDPDHQTFTGLNKDKDLEKVETDSRVPVAS